MEDAFSNNVNADERDGEEALQQNPQGAQNEAQYDDGSDDSQNFDEAVVHEANEPNNQNTFSEITPVAQERREEESASDVFSIDAMPPVFGDERDHAAPMEFHEPTDIKWPPQIRASPPKRDGSDDSENEFMTPVRSGPKAHRKGRESYGNVVSEMSFFEKFGNTASEDAEYTTEFKKKDGSDDSTTEPRIHHKAQESYGNVMSGMSFFQKFGEDDEDEPIPLNVSSPKSDETSSSDAFMTPPEKKSNGNDWHRKGLESYGNVVNDDSFFSKFGSTDNDEPVSVRSVEEPQVRSTRNPEELPQSKISTVISSEEAERIPKHRQKQASVGFAISDLSFSSKFMNDDDDPPPVYSVSEVEPSSQSRYGEPSMSLASTVPYEPSHENVEDVGEEASTSDVSGNNETDELQTMRQEIKKLRRQLEEAHRRIEEQNAALSSAQNDLQACKESKIRYIQSSSQEITRLKDVIGILAKQQNCEKSCCH